MTRLLLASLLALLAAAPAAAGERNYSVASFDRIRVDGPFRILLTTGKAPSARAEGDPRVTDTLDIRVEGTTLMVRAGVNGWGEQPAARAAGAPVIYLSTPTLRTATMVGGGELTITGPVKAQRVELSLTGSGTLSADGLDADQFVATVIGSGTMKLAGRTARARLSTNGPAQILAGALVANDLIVRTDGSGEMVAQARYTAAVSTAGFGAVTVYGSPACTISTNPNGPVSCGKLPPPR